jgi:ABC-type antimicrobial peptide transport system permease subunit
MLLLAVVNAVIVAVFAVHDSAANHARMRASGLTPRQTMAALLTTQAVASLGAALIGVPLGLLLFRIAYVAANGDDQALVFARPLWVLGAVVATAVVCTAAAAAPAGLLSRRPVAQTLAVE